MHYLKKIASYFWDIPIERTSSTQNDYLEVVWSNGRKMLNSRNANYSFGNGYKVFEYAFKRLRTELGSVKRVLVLGFGCGSVEHLIKRMGLNCEIVGIEYDPEIVRMYKAHFADYEQVELITEDALEFLRHNQDSFDLIIIDLFNDLETSPLIFQKEFTSLVLKASSDQAALVYNTVKATRSHDQRTELALELNKRFKHVEFIPFQEINEIILAK